MQGAPELFGLPGVHVGAACWGKSGGRVTRGVVVVAADVGAGGEGACGCTAGGAPPLPGAGGGTVDGVARAVVLA
ncbi:hypothetical protein HF577_37005, partial [Pseudonocardia xinjiangensis]|nr:hypothetical protein [Pseudonocardia xinjiangensis]